MNILWIRPDSIGDAVLAASMLPYIKKTYPASKLFVVCQQFLAELYQACPFVDQVIGFDKKKCVVDQNYRNNLLQTLRNLNIDLVLNSVFSRELSMDCLATKIEAHKSVGFKIMKRRSRFDFPFRYNQGYSQLISSPQAWKSELERHKDFLAGIEIQVDELFPQIWTTTEDESFADTFFKDHHLNTETTVALFAGALSDHRLYPSYGAALSTVMADKHVTILAFGAQKDYAINEKNLSDSKLKTINLCGKTTLRQTAALLRRCAFALGAETGLAHIACAVGLPHVVLLGGGHFGRFMPYSPLTSAVVLPLTCFGCDWNCKYKKTYCVQDVSIDLLAYAITKMLEQPSIKPRIFLQTYYSKEKGGPDLQFPKGLIDPTKFELIWHEDRHEARNCGMVQLR